MGKRKGRGRTRRQGNGNKIVVAAISLWTWNNSKVSNTCLVSLWFPALLVLLSLRQQALIAKQQTSKIVLESFQEEFLCFAFALNGENRNYRAPTETHRKLPYRRIVFYSLKTQTKKSSFERWNFISRFSFSVARRKFSPSSSHVLIFVW